MTLPPVRILMATYQGAPYLRAQLDSFAAQTHRDWALWVSDDGSTDGTRSVLSAFATAHPNREIRLFNGPEKGSSANFLSLVSRAAAERDDRIVALSDQDDVWRPDRLVRAARALADAPAWRPALYAAHTVLTDAHLRPLSCARPQRIPGSFRATLVQNVLAGNTMALNGPALRLAGSARPHRAVPFHDWWLALLITGAEGTVLSDPHATVLYRQHGRNLLGAHAGTAARLRRARLVLNGTYGRWCRTNLAALRGLDGVLSPGNKALVATLTDHPTRGGRDRLEMIRTAGLQRDSRTGQAALSALALAGQI